MKITKLTTYIVSASLDVPENRDRRGHRRLGRAGRRRPGADRAGRRPRAGRLSDRQGPFLIEDHWNVMYRAGFYRGGAIHMSAIAGIDQALWDIKGKALGQPMFAARRPGARQDQGLLLDRRRPSRRRRATMPETWWRRLQGDQDERLRGAADSSTARRRSTRPSPRSAPFATPSAPISALALDFHGRVHRRWPRCWPRSWSPSS
jgi:galactonate dehydratase